VFRSKLDEISGVSTEHKVRLLKHFKTLEAMAQASVEELAKVGRMPGALARKVHAVLNQDG
jgi:excinuclease ABC subunit C